MKNWCKTDVYISLPVFHPSIQKGPKDLFTLLPPLWKVIRDKSQVHLADGKQAIGRLHTDCFPALTLKMPPHCIAHSCRAVVVTEVTWESACARNTLSWWHWCAFHLTTTHSDLSSSAPLPVWPDNVIYSSGAASPLGKIKHFLLQVPQVCSGYSSSRRLSAYYLHQCASSVHFTISDKARVNNWVCYTVEYYRTTQSHYVLQYDFSN